VSESSPIYGRRRGFALRDVSCRIGLLMWFLPLCCVEAEQRGRIGVVGPSHVSFGAHWPYEVQKTSFMITNSGSASLLLKSIRQTCKCARVSCGKLAIEPGETTFVSVEVLPYTVFGPYRASIYIESSDPSNRFSRVEVEGVMKELVRVRPSSSLYIGAALTNGMWSGVFKLTPLVSQIGFGEVKVERSNCKIHAVLSLDSESDGGSRDLSVTVSVPEDLSPPVCILAIPVVGPSNHPPLTVQIYGRASARLLVSPQEILLQRSEEPIYRDILLTLVPAGKSCCGGNELEASVLRLPDDKDVSFVVKRNSTTNSVTVTACFSPRFLDDLPRREKASLFFGCPWTRSALVTCRADNRERERR